LQRPPGAHDDATGALFDLPTSERRERRSEQRLAGFETETGMMPRAAHRGADQQSVRQGSPIVRAASINGKDVLATARQENGLVANASREHSPVGKRRAGDALSQVGTRRFPAL
jgi:hypothetical protein